MFPLSGSNFTLSVTVPFALDFIWIFKVYYQIVELQTLTLLKSSFISLIFGGIHPNFFLCSLLHTEIANDQWWRNVYQIQTGIFPPKYRLNFLSAFNMADIEVNYAKAKRDTTFVSVMCTGYRSCLVFTLCGLARFSCIKLSALIADSFIYRVCCVWEQGS